MTPEEIKAICYQMRLMLSPDFVFAPIDQELFDARVSPVIAAALAASEQRVDTDPQDVASPGSPQEKGEDQ